MSAPEPLSPQHTPATESQESAEILMRVTTSRTFNYYQEQTDAQGTIWVLVEEGWLARRHNGRDLATVAPATPARP